MRIHGRGAASARSWPGQGLKLGSVTLLVGLSGLILSLLGCQGSNVNPTAPEQAASNHAHNPKVVVIGDSLSTGYGTSPEYAWPQLINADPHDTDDTDHKPDLKSAAQNGSGYTAIGDNRSTFGSQVEQEVEDNTGLVLFFGSVNDRGKEPAAIANAAMAAYAAAKATAPGATLLVVGPPSYTDMPDAQTLAVRDAVEKAAGAAGVTFVDPIAQGWFLGQAPGLVGPDGVHLSVAGQRYVQVQMRNLIEKYSEATPATGAAPSTQGT
ncbi:hypothetical protein AOC05_03125 [Arthrobacter alpinus]|uniref:SGNH hydrolase-type esterase domain-containing protein n=1 Tax=Arthrobacter alpinus TaxID=656366 RepID=A0A0M3UH65_9MICC|nr:hypothetical protein AOC05_03125 [Arthrobacter alpinus]